MGWLAVGVGFGVLAWWLDRRERLIEQRRAEARERQRLLRRELERHSR